MELLKAIAAKPAQQASIPQTYKNITYPFYDNTMKKTF